MRKIDVRLDIVRGEIACGPAVGACSACACESTDPVVASVQIVWPFATPSELCDGNEARRDQGWPIIACLRCVFALARLLGVIGFESNFLGFRDEGFGVGV